MTTVERNELLHRAYYRGGGPWRPYPCRRCGRVTFAVSDERREHERSHARQRKEVSP